MPEGPESSRPAVDAGSPVQARHGLAEWRDPGGWRLRLDERTIARFTAQGAWRGTTIAERLDTLAAARPDHLLLIDGRHRISAGDLRSLALRLAHGLSAKGLGPGSVVSFQLPNWHEAVAIELACAYGGFVCQPIVPIFRESEVSFMLADSGSRVLFIPERFRNFDYPAMIENLRGACPDLDHVVVVRGAGGGLSFDELSTGPALASGRAADPNQVKLILYTSGTTSRPKGVLHTHNTIDAEIGNFSSHLGLTAEDVVLMPSTLCHITGYLYAIQLPITLGARAVLMESWNAGEAADLIEEHGVTLTVGATPFIQELAAHARQAGRGLPTLRYFPTGGAPVPPSVIELAESAFENCMSFRIYGSTEAPTVTLGALDADREARATTEGVVVGHQVGLVDEGRNVVPAGETGEIVTQGPEVFVGYIDWQQTEEAFDEDGFFHTGDLGRFTPESRLVIVGRKKDIIIRGGENISPAEVEDILIAHPSVNHVAVVGMPHPRLGETGCAFVTLAGEFDINTMRAALAEKSVAKQKWPEALVVLDELPFTAAGKIKKEQLRRVAQNMFGSHDED